MKLKNLLLIGVAIVFASCGGEKKDSSENDTVGDADTLTEEPTAPTILAVNHQVTDFGVWHAAYLEKSKEDSRIGVLQSIDDPNMVHVAEKSKSHEAVMERMGSEEMKATMAEAGVVGEPEVTLENVRYMNESPAELKAGDHVAIIRHEVKDYDAWKVHFDADNDNRVKAGMECRALLTVEGNDNMVVLVFGVKDLEACQGMLADPKMAEVMAEAGVMGEPSVSYWVVPGGE
jgi:hypothetical protein